MPKEEYIRIPLIEGWQNKKIASKRFPLSFKYKAIVDYIFDSLHNRGYIKFVIKLTPFVALVFITRKEHLIIDLCIVNKLAILDIYPILL